MYPIQLHTLIIMFHTVFFRTLAILAFFTLFCFQYIIPLGLQFMGLGFAGIFLEVVREGAVPIVVPLDLTQWATQYLHFLPFFSLKGALIYSFVSYGLHTLFRRLFAKKTPYIQHIIIGLVLYAGVALPYLQSAFSSSLDEVITWIFVITAGSTFTILTSMVDIQNAPKLQAIPVLLLNLGKKFWKL